MQVQLWTLVGQLTHASLYQPSEEGTNGTMTSPKGTKGTAHRHHRTHTTHGPSVS